ncbi:MAG: DUF3419 family protein [Planctomycetes bacterium]|nr:DUF3419 family protein [Planctomycetota bacterium]
MRETIADRVDLGIIRYANCWEDADILVEALRPRPGTRFVSIASAGDNSFALLAAGAEVVAADLSVPQLACVEIRRAAFRSLDYEPLLAFLGVRESTERLAVYEGLRPDLSESARAFWDGRRDQVSTGLIHGGKFEAYFKTFRTRVLPLTHSPRTILSLLEERDPEARRRFYEETWNNWRWRFLFRLFFSRRVMGWLGRDPQFFKYVEGSVADNILGKARKGMMELPTHANPYLTYITTGNFGAALPRYLRREHFAAIKAGLDRLTIHQGPIEQAASAHRGAAGFDGFNLSDIFEYLDLPTCRTIYATLLESARPGARLVYWNMMAPRRRPDELADRVTVLDDLARELHARDRAFFYSAFVVEEVR